MPYSFAICKIGLTLASWAISMSEGTGRRSLMRVGLKNNFFFGEVFPLGDGDFAKDFLDFVAMCSPRRFVDYECSV
jgi:hypothetical protein